ncbi:MAG: bifunctional N(6)-L-threonylcarbamoyladenine synthase/serine/threonine protein kinase [Candidatus Thermoplasmatota archaeon]|jgi:N6-L-threonylcarbamoyladenine synthase/protein kinase Bud32|nr:bifunctional N(6)-L-threonylcarbamoyladenine synthase/serine/threonine protein kinase [Candidatus Thermoplasmatota archaeon]MCL5680425.1 bifunctional N(6)-L-threonylcarbamoyladenine synthase/serine/threonine protein kinase [Candidatus Thermoplasmatota archaeon]
MRVLGIESTAHTASVGLVEDGRIIGFRSHTHIPKEGGIKPKEAADHHREYFPELLRQLLDEHSLNPQGLDRIAFSIGPGLGPSLKTGASLARFLSLKYGKPIVPINHGVGHLEISRSLSRLKNPLFLYISGGNTQLVSRGSGRYLVLGETLDIGIGNFLDKVAREMGIPFPGAPVLEKLALNGSKVLDCPYTVKGMDVSYSGLFTYLKNKIGEERKEDIAFNAQEFSFTALAEILERGMAHFGFSEFTITGGVARNGRLREMLSEMAKMRKYDYFFPPDQYLSDNGAMIALAGYYSSNVGSLEEEINQRDRLDSRDSPWIGKSSISSVEMVGGESVVTPSNLFDLFALSKRRLKKDYRVDRIDRSISIQRMKKEIRILNSLRELGINVPMIYYADFEEREIVMERIVGTKLSSALSSGGVEKIVSEAGKMVGKMHAHHISHGDLTPGNILVGDKIYLIDASMGELNAEIEDMGVDIHLMKESLKSLGAEELFQAFIKGYLSSNEEGKLVVEKVKEIEGRRRYV